MTSKRLYHIGIALLLLAPAFPAHAEGPGVVEQLKNAIMSAGIDVARAIEFAQREEPTGKIVDAEFRWDRQPPYFEVELLVGTQLKELKFNTSTGKLLGNTDQKLDEEGRAAVAAARQTLLAAKLTLAQAIEIATRESKIGPPLGVQLMGEQAQPIYEVKVLDNDKLRKVRIDAVDGKIFAVDAEALPLAVWTFDATEVGTLPADFVAKETHPGGKPGLWKIAADQAAPSKPNVLSLTTSAPDATFNVGIFEHSSYQDLDLRVWLRANSGQEDQGGGLIWRCQDENKYYTCRLNPLESNFRVYQVVDGKRKQLASAELKAEAGRWYQVRAVMVGDQIACYVDGKKYLDATDDTLKGAGRVGLWTKADASSSFDNLKVYAPVTEKSRQSRPADATSQPQSVPAPGTSN